MLKRALRALFLLPFLIAGITPANAAGTIAYSLSQQLDQYGKPLINCFLYTIQAGTTSTPQNAYKDTGLTLPQPNPMRCDAAGRLPQFFLADGQIKISLQDQFGVVQVVADNILVIGPSSGGGGGGTVDPTTIFTTGDVKSSYGNQVITGWVRLNGRTIGSATSGATERANADTQALFQYLWTADPNLAVSGGRGASSIADWTANKTIALPDGRGRVITGLDDMGNTAAGRFGTATFTSGSATTLGSTIGTAQVTLALSNLPNFAPSFTGSAGTVNTTSNNGAYLASSIAAGVNSGGSGALAGIAGVSSLQSVTASGSFTPAGSVQSINGGQAQTATTTISPMILVTNYIKL